jgi:hypothetical protein
MLWSDRVNLDRPAGPAAEQATVRGGFMPGEAVAAVGLRVDGELVGESGVGVPPLGLEPSARPPASEQASRMGPAGGGNGGGRHVLFVAWRDLANPRAGGSEVLVDRLAEGLIAGGDRVTLLCGGEVAERPYRVVRSGGTYSQFLRTPMAYWRHLSNCDLVVEVCNGMPFFAPLWCRRPTICLVNHVHTELWGMRFPAPLAPAGDDATRQGRAGERREPG